MKNEFKVGDRVKIREWDDMAKEFGVDKFSGNIRRSYVYFIKEMKHLCGRTGIVTDILGLEVRLNFDDKSGDTNWHYSTDMIEPLFSNEKITIERYGNKVVAKWGKRTGVAKCNPEDKFDFATGALLAFDRLFNSENLTRKIIDDAIDRVRDELYEINGIKKIE